MDADTSAQPAGRPTAVRTRAVAVIDTRERAFWLGLAFAALLHAALIAGFVRSPPRQMGEASGLADGISVELVEAADLEAKNTFAEDGAQPGASADPVPKPPPPQAAAEPKPPSAPPAPTPEQQPQQPEQQTKSPAADPAPPAAAADPPEAAPRPPAQAKANPWAPDIAALDLAKPPPPAEPPKRGDQPAKTAPAKKEPQPAEQFAAPQLKPQQKLALQFDPPPLTFAPGSRGAAVARPAGVTRSGENDEFGRGVIRALRKTMPSSSVLGRVTVRLLLSETGNLAEVRLVASAGDPILDQNVVFAVKQASFPIPPAGATVIDRTFQITYVYH